MLKLTLSIAIGLISHSNFAMAQSNIESTLGFVSGESCFTLCRANIVDRNILLTAAHCIVQARYFAYRSNSTLCVEHSAPSRSKINYLDSVVSHQFRERIDVISAHDDIGLIFTSDHDLPPNPICKTRPASVNDEYSKAGLSGKGLSGGGDFYQGVLKGLLSRNSGSSSIFTTVDQAAIEENFPGLIHSIEFKDCNSD